MQIEYFNMQSIAAVARFWVRVPTYSTLIQSACNLDQNVDSINRTLMNHYVTGLELPKEYVIESSGTQISSNSGLSKRGKVGGMIEVNNVSIILTWILRIENLYKYEMMCNFCCTVRLPQSYIQVFQYAYVLTLNVFKTPSSRQV